MPDTITSARKRARLTQAEVAGIVGVDTSTITHLETGRRRPSLSLLARLRTALSLTNEEVAQIVVESEGPTEQEVAA